ncbi:GL17750 [Drosophila persimilis]|uniref:GL17750 n=1 Tax=Drosophila persimilis TaxID=7234 RepID=B4GIN8_DROPE|nr:ITG-like peptide [Drosophila persimilis]EDW36358.1 GL17750 [Drosophila persimilis]
MAKMRNIPLRAALLLLLGMAMHLHPSVASSAFASGTAWQRTLFGRDSTRNLMRRSPPSVLGAGDGSTAYDGGPMGGYKEYKHIYGPYPNEQEPREAHPQQLRQQTEVYGIVEPLIEDTPCADRPCLVSEDCCPTGVCVNTNGEGKCVYVFGHQRDICQRHGDCVAGSVCMLVAEEGVWRCEIESESSAAPSLLEEMIGVRRKQPLGSDCNSSSDCQMVNGMCCQQQRLNHRASIKRICGYFRDAFDCVDMVGAEHPQHRRY